MGWAWPIPSRHGKGTTRRMNTDKREWWGPYTNRWKNSWEKKWLFPKRKGWLVMGEFSFDAYHTFSWFLKHLGNFYEEWQSISMVMTGILNPHLPSWFSKVTGESGIGGEKRMNIGTLPTSVFLCPYWEGQIRGEDGSYVSWGRGWRQVLYPLWPMFSFLMTSMTEPFFTFQSSFFFIFFFPFL